MFEKSWFEEFYKTEDPWSYKTMVDDAYRKSVILDTISEFGPFDRALDIGCGEGFITEHIPAKTIHGIEISDLAASRLPSNIHRVHSPDGQYDLVMTTGTLYKEYDNKQIIDWIHQSASRIVLVAGIKSWFVPFSFGKLVKTLEFDYRSHLGQQVLVYEVSA
jgi:hypothetical protein